MSLTLASQVIGFISFSITLATLLGVYSDLLKTLRGAPTTIPLALGNLREELQYEKLYLRQKQKQRDEFGALPDTNFNSRRQRQDFGSLIDQTLQHLWKEFCELERPFIVQGETPWTLSVDDGTSGLHHVFSTDEKLAPDRRRRSARQPQRRESYKRNRMGMIEAGLSSDRSTYYRTDLAARFLWWWKSDDLRHLGDQIQRIQLRRVERDVYETDEIIKRLYKFSCDQYGWNPKGNDSGDDSAYGRRRGPNSDDSGGGNGPTRARSRGDPSSGPNRRSHRRRRSGMENSFMAGERDYHEREIIRRRARSRGSQASPPEPRPATRQSGRSRPGSVVYEYEVVNPGRIYVDIDSPRDETDRRRGRPRSYSRDRE